MLSFEQLQAKVGKSISIMRQPRVKMGIVMKEFDKIAKTFGRWVEPNFTVCQTGCNYCCFGMPILLSKLEFEYVQRAAKFNFLHTGPWMRQYSDKWKAFSKIFGPTHEATLEAWRGARIPCPMLNDDKMCVIYENRPIVCRIRWTPEFFLSDCFPGSPIYPMLDGPAQASAYEVSDPLIPPHPRRTIKSPIRQLIENTLKDIDKWVYNFQGNQRPLVEVIEPSFTV